MQDGEEEKETGDFEDVNSEDEDDDDDDDGPGYKKKELQIKTVKRRRDSKMIQKAKKQQGRFKANGNRKNKQWIMKKKERQRRQGVEVKADSKYSGRKRPARW